MVIALCVDDRFGMLFNGRRQSMDSRLRESLLQHAGEERLWMNAYSADQFSPLRKNICVREDFLRCADLAELCFVENTDIAESLPGCQKLILYSWNRKYPADVYFPKEILNAWRLVSSRDFTGSSHDVITERIYEKL